MRIQVNFSDDMVKRIDLYANSWGLSRSAFIAFVIGQHIYTMERTYKSLDNLPSHILSKEMNKHIKKSN